MYRRFVLASTVLSKIRMQEQHQTFCFKIVGLVPSAVLMVKGQWCQAEPRCEELVDFVNWCKPTLILCCLKLLCIYFKVFQNFRLFANLSLFDYMYFLNMCMYFYVLHNLWQFSVESHSCNYKYCTENAVNTN